MSASPRPARWAERASLALLAAGVAVYGVAFVQMRRLEAGAPAAPEGAKVLFAGLVAHARYARWAEVGLWIVAAGVTTAVAATIWTAVMKRRRPG
ncbi:MAG: hypothetical protein ACXW61_11385 [Gemmatirosa sp.]